MNGKPNIKIKYIILLQKNRFKQFGCAESSAEATKYLKWAKQHIKATVLKYGLTRAAEAPESPSPKVPTKRLRFFDREFANDTHEYIPSTSTLEQQFNKYKSSNEDDDIGALEFWAKHESKYPMLAKVARVLFVFMASSVPCEGLFSDAGYALWERRTALSEEKSEKIVLIQHNLKCSDY
jgi:hypothetical protein